MSNPVLVEALRGALVESRHRGSFAVMDADGRLALEAGDTATPIYPRSAVKALQALPLLETGVADSLALTDAEIALACASHAGERFHVEAAASMLAKAGRDADCLECGAHWPMGEAAKRELAASGRAPSQLHNNCSGKHAGFVCLACGTGEDPAGYIGASHPVQAAVREALEATTGVPHDPEEAGIDGCSIPTHPVPLRALALAFARFGTGRGLGPERAKAAARIRRAVAAHPEMVGGTGTFDTRLMTVLRERAFVKVGAEGVYCAALPIQGLGVALKCDDGGTRAAEVAMAALAARFVKPSGAEAEAIQALVRPALLNWKGTRVGELRAAGPLES